MPKNKRSLRISRILSARPVKFILSLPKKFVGALLFIWNRPLIASIILLIAAAFLFRLITSQAFIQYFNCKYLLVDRLGADELLCKGVHFNPLPGIEFDINGLNSYINPPLEWIRRGITWLIIFFFVIASLFLAKITEIFRSLVKLLAFNKEEWGRLLTNLKTLLFIFACLCILFYFTVMIKN